MFELQQTEQEIAEKEEKRYRLGMFELQRERLNRERDEFRRYRLGMFELQPFSKEQVSDTDTMLSLGHV